MKDMTEVRVLRWYEKEPGNELVGEAELLGVSLAELQKLFRVPAADQMYDCYPVDERHIEYLRQCVRSEINLSKYDYFVECNAAT
jgi:hypothetical protein